MVVSFALHDDESVSRGGPIAGDSGWLLWHRPQGDGNGWRRIVLENGNWPARNRKAKYWGGWNGERLSRSRDLEILRQYHPAIYGRLAATCQGLWGQSVAGGRE